jgi:hypothetical protein
MDPRQRNRPGVAADLLRASWKAGGYHLRLNSLQRAEDCAADLDDESQAKVLALLESFTPDHLFLNSACLTRCPPTKQWSQPPRSMISVDT